MSHSIIQLWSNDLTSKSHLVVDPYVQLGISKTTGLYIMAFVVFMRLSCIVSIEWRWYNVIFMGISYNHINGQSIPTRGIYKQRQKLNSQRSALLCLSHMHWSVMKHIYNDVIFHLADKLPAGGIHTSWEL